MSHLMKRLCACWQRGLLPGTVGPASFMACVSLTWKLSRLLKQAAKVAACFEAQNSEPHVMTSLRLASCNKGPALQNDAGHFDLMCA